MAAAAAINCTHLSHDSTIGIPSPTTISTTTGFILPYCYRTVLRHTIHLDFCPPISRATATHTSSSSVSDSSTSPILPGTTASSHNTSRTSSHHYTDTSFSNTTTDSDCQLSIHRSPMCHPPGRLATLFSLSPRHTTSTPTGTPTTTSTNHHCLNANPTSISTAATIGSSTTDPTNHHHCPGQSTPSPKHTSHSLTTFSIPLAGPCHTSTGTFHPSIRQT